MLKLKSIFLGKRSKQKVKLPPVIAAYGVCYRLTPTTNGSHLSLRQS